MIRPYSHLVPGGHGPDPDVGVLVAGDEVVLGEVHSRHQVTVGLGSMA